MPNNDSNLKGNSSTVKLKKGINLFTGCCIITGNIIGSGIFITSQSVMESTKSQGVALIVWVLSGCLSLVGAYCYTELGTLIQTSGGDYAYLSQSYGRFISFLYTYAMVFIIVPCLNAIFGRTISLYIVKLIYPNCEPDNIYYLIRIIAALVITTLCMVNMSNVKLVSKVQAIFTVTKICALLIIVTAGFYNYFMYSPYHPSEILKSWYIDSEFEFDGLAKAFYSGLFAYSGWNCLNFLTEEIREPTKNLPRAIFLSLPFITLTYLVTNMAYFLVLSPEEIYKTEAVALTFSEKALSSCPWITSIFISISTLGALSGCMLGSSRVYYAAARDGMLPQCFSLISTKTYTPVTCILLQTFIALMMLFVKDIDNLILYGTFSELFFIFISITSVLYYRYSRPHAIRPIKVHICFPLIFMSIVSFLILLTLYQNPVETGYGILFLMGGIPLYCIGILWEKKPKAITNFSDNLTKICQILLNSVKED